MKKLISALLILTMLVSMVCISTSAAGVHVNMNFESMDVFTSQFIAGQFYTNPTGGLLYGYAEAKALQTIYGTDDDLDIFDNTGYTWLTYDASITLSVSDDNLSEASRFINLSYCNDNLKDLGREENRVYMAFMYDIQERCFRFAPGHNNTTEEEQYLPPVYMEIDTEGEDFFTMGISVDKDRIRCFYNDTLIFDLNDTARDYVIADHINSCFLFWQDGNFVQISNITVADQGYLYPEIVPADTTATQEPTPTVTTTTDDGGNVGDDTNNTDNGGNVGETTTTKETTTRIESEVVTNDKGETSVVTKVVTEATTTPAAQTNTNRPTGGSSTATGDATFVVIAAMVATLGTALIVRKVSVK